MTTTDSTPKTVDLIAMVRATEPRIDSVKAEWQDVVASMVISGFPFETAVAKFSALIENADKELKAAKESKRSIQEKTEKEFQSAIEQSVSFAADAIDKVLRPHQWIIRVDYEAAAKNVDGSPKVDAAGNAVIETKVDAKATWSVRQVSETGVSSGARRGRLGGYVRIEGIEGQFDNLKAAAEKLNLTGANSRIALNEAGYSVPSDVTETDSDGKKFMTITKSSANGATA